MMKYESRSKRNFLKKMGACGLTLAISPKLMAAEEPKVQSVIVEGSRDVQIALERNSDPVINNLQRRTFRFFWNTAHRETGLIPDRYPTPSFASIAAVGFGLTAYVIGAERGFVSRSQARIRTLRTLRFLANLQQGPEETGRAGYKGFFYHFIDMDTGHRFGTSELSTVDTALML